MQSLTDEQLMEIYQGNKDGQGTMALDYLYNRYSIPMFCFFYFSLHNDSDKAQDFMHDLFVRIIEKKHTFNNNQSFKAWIYRIASNICKNDFRSAKVIQKYISHILSTSEPIISNNETERILSECISKLRQEQRSIIVLRFKLKLTIKEIAEIYECPEGTIKSRLFYAIKELSKTYKE
jgi:RNA polymerase sigma-70 factor (ECF subfamily)